MPEASCRLLSIHLVPHCASAWKQYGDLLFSATKARRATAKAAAPAAPTAGWGAGGTLDDRQQQLAQGDTSLGYVAAVEAYCR